MLGRRTSAPLVRGRFKSLPNNPLRPDGAIHEYCPPEQVDSEMDRLIELHHQHDDVSPEVEAAWLHHRFTQIHPFQDGNGRIARGLATLVFIKAGWFPLVVRDAERGQYIDALEDADRGDLRPLVNYFAKLQRTEFVRALSIVEEVRQELRVTETIESVRRQIQKRKAALVADWKSAKTIAASLRDQSEVRLEEVASELRWKMVGILEHGDFFVDGNADGESRSHYYRNQLIQTANELDYFADFHVYAAWSRLVLKNSNQTELLIAFHGVGRGFGGVLGCSASLFQRIETEKGEREVGPVTPVVDNVFLINYKESLRSSEARFLRWLDEAIIRSLRLWQDTAV